MKKSVNIFKYSFIVYFALCAAYVTELTMMSPYYFGLIFCLTSICLYIILKSKIILDIKTCFLIVILNGIIVQLLICGQCNNYDVDAYVKNIILLIVNQLTAVICLLMCINYHIIKDDILRGSIWFYRTVLIIGIADFIYRVLNSTWGYSGYLFFQNFKSNSLMFGDSNYIGFMFMISFVFFLYLKRRLNMAKNSQLVVLFIMTFLSMSRAALGGLLITFFIDRFIKNSHHLRLKACLIIIMLILVGSYIWTILEEIDDSLLTKTWVLDGILAYLHNASWSDLLIGQGSEVLSGEPKYWDAFQSGHLYLFIKIIGSGFIGLILDLLFFSQIMYISKGKTWYVLLPFFLAGLSFCPTNLSYMYFFIGVIMYMEGYTYRQLDYKKNKSHDDSSKVMKGK